MVAGASLQGQGARPRAGRRRDEGVEEERPRLKAHAGGGAGLRDGEVFVAGARRAVDDEEVELVAPVTEWTSRRNCLIIPFYLRRAR